MCGAVRMSADSQGGQKRALDLMGLELQALLSHLTWELGTELWFSERAASS